MLLTVEDKESIVAFISRMGQQLSDSMAHAGFSFVDIAHEYGISSCVFHGYMLSAALQDKRPLIRLRDWSWADLAVKAAQRNKIILR